MGSKAAISALRDPHPVGFAQRSRPTSPLQSEVRSSLRYQKISDATALGRGTVPAMHRSGPGVGASLLRMERGQFIADLQLLHTHESRLRGQPARPCPHRAHRIALNRNYELETTIEKIFHLYRFGFGGYSPRSIS